MSYASTANLFFGVSISRQDLFKALGFDPEGDHYEEVLEEIEGAGFYFLNMGNMVIAGDDHGIAMINFQAEEEKVVSLSSKKMLVDPTRLKLLKAFLKKHGIAKKPGWHLAATYG